MSKRIALCVSVMNDGVIPLSERSRQQYELSLACYRKISLLNDTPVRLWRESIRYQFLRNAVRASADACAVAGIDRSRRELAQLIDDTYAALDGAQENCGVAGHPDLSALPSLEGTGKAPSVHLPLHERATQCLTRFEHTHTRVVRTLTTYCRHVEKQVFGGDLEQVRIDEIDFDDDSEELLDVRSFTRRASTGSPLSHTSIGV